jgi:formiminoglutamase
MYHAPDMSVWQGRIDTEEAALARRWHERVGAWHVDAAPGWALLGFACDAGVARNQGRPGASQGPAAIRRALANLAWHHDRPVWDAGDVVCDSDHTGDGLEAAQAALGLQLASLLEAGQRPIVLGGGHEVAWGSFLGLARHAESHPGWLGRSPHIGIVNFDAHFDLRAGNRASSGTPFRQIAEACASNGLPFNYLVLGIAETANTAALFHRARELGVQWALDTDCLESRLPTLQDTVNAFADTVDWLYVTICLDVFPAAVAPGVSAPSALGVPVAVVEALIETLKATGKLKLADIAELNPGLDRDQQTARLAARLVWRLVR